MKGVSDTQLRIRYFNFVAKREFLLPNIQNMLLLFSLALKINNLSIGTCSACASLKAKESVGSYLLFSIALMVCLVTLHILAKSS